MPYIINTLIVHDLAGPLNEHQKLMILEVLHPVCIMGAVIAAAKLTCQRVMTKKLPYK